MPIKSIFVAVLTVLVLWGIKQFTDSDPVTVNSVPRRAKEVKEPPKVIEDPISPVKTTPIEEPVTTEVVAVEPFQPEQPKTVQSPYYRSIKQTVSRLAFEKFLEAYKASNAVRPFIDQEDFNISSLGPKLNLYDSTNFEGSEQLFLFVNESGVEDHLTVYTYLGINSNSVINKDDIKIAQDNSGDENYLIRSIRIPLGTLICIWKKLDDKHSQDQIDQFKSSFRSSP